MLTSVKQNEIPDWLYMNQEEIECRGEIPATGLCSIY